MCLATAAVALAAGAASGFFGIGGGFLIVPGLMLATGMPMISAVGTPLLSVGTFGLATALNYACSGLVDWVLAAQFIGGGILGMLLAVCLSGYKSIVNRLFAALVLSGYMLYQNWGESSPDGGRLQRIPFCGDAPPGGTAEYVIQKRGLHSLVSGTFCSWQRKAHCLRLKCEVAD
jgi:hypothetical protein